MTESTVDVNLGHKGRGQVYLRLPAYLAETEKAAREEPRESLMHFYREQAERLRDSMSRAGTRAIEGRAERLDRLLPIQASRPESCSIPTCCNGLCATSQLAI